MQLLVTYGFIASENEHLALTSLGAMGGLGNSTTNDLFEIDGSGSSSAIASASASANTGAGTASSSSWSSDGEIIEYED